MSWLNEISIIANQSKQLNYNQQQIIALLQEQNQLLRQLLPNQSNN